MSFRKNYLPRQSQAWARELQSRIEQLEQQTITNEINNRTRDDQLQSSYNRLDAAFSLLASQQSTLAAQQSALEDLVEDVSDAADAAQDAADDAAAAASAAGTAAAIANNAINRLETYTTEYYPINESVNFSQTSGTILSENITVSLSTSGGGSRDISAIAICSVDAGVNSPGGTDDTPHRLTLTGTVSVGGATGSSKSFVGVRKGFTDSELGFNDSQVAVYGGGALVPSASRSYSSSTNVTINASINIDASQIAGGFYFGSARIEGILVTISG